MGDFRMVMEDREVQYLGLSFDRDFILRNNSKAFVLVGLTLHLKYQSIYKKRKTTQSKYNLELLHQCFPPTYSLSSPHSPFQLLSSQMFALVRWEGGDLAFSVEDFFYFEFKI